MRYRCKKYKGLVRVSVRQERILGWDQERLSRSVVLVAGAGGLGGEIVEGLVQKGVGRIDVCDFDVVTPTNLNRQKFTVRDLWKNKALRLARTMRKRGFLGTFLQAHPCSVQEVLQ